eukprot:jgi/Botrbrau1/11564/Bobra.60_1s0016.1
MMKGASHRTSGASHPISTDMIVTWIDTRNYEPDCRQSFRSNSIIGPPIIFKVCTWLHWRMEDESAMGDIYGQPCIVGHAQEARFPCKLAELTGIYVDIYEYMTCVYT